MNQINQITSDPRQTFKVSLEDGSTFSITIYYIPQQFGWFITNITYGTFVLNTYRIVVSPNMLNQFRNQIPFGLACSVDGNREPTQQQDFLSGAAKLYVLTQQECSDFERFLQGG